MLDTAKQHFDQDIGRARALLAAAPQVAIQIKSDVLRAAFMMGVGACDAYFCDAYADLLSRAIRAKEFQPEVGIPDRLNNLRLPVSAIIRETRGGWRWRVAARELMERENVLSIEKIKGLFNHLFRKGHKILNEDTIADWIVHRDARNRLFGISATQYRAATPADKSKLKKEAISKFEERFGELFQRRHDCIHNCDRPKMALQNITETFVEKASQDIEFLVVRCHGALIAEFPHYLAALGFSGLTRNQVGA